MISLVDLALKLSGDRVCIGDRTVDHGGYRGVSNVAGIGDRIAVASILEKATSDGEPSSNIGAVLFLDPVLTIRALPDPCRKILWACSLQDDGIFEHRVPPRIPIAVEATNVIEVQANDRRSESERP